MRDTNFEMRRDLKKQMRDASGRMREELRADTGGEIRRELRAGARLELLKTSHKKCTNSFELVHWKILNESSR